MEIQVGEYIRTKDGIKKIVKINEGKSSTYYGKYIVFPEYKNSKSINIKNILKHDFDIRKLIEEGDFVNGNEITQITLDPFIKGQINLWTDIELRDVYGDYERLKYTSVEEIETIVTKEQFKAMEYEVK